MRHCLTAGMALMLSASAAADAQPKNAAPEKIAAFNAMILTPAGALPQIVHVQRSVGGASLADVALRYGRYNFRDPSLAFDNVGFSAAAHAGRRLQVGGTIARRSCNGCQGVTMGSADIAFSLFRKGAEGDIGGDTDLGLQLSAGLGKLHNSDVSARSVMLSAPLAISLPQAESSLLTLFVSPSIAYGRFTNVTTDGATIGMIGAGAGYTFDFGLGAHAALHRILVEDSPTQFGFGISYQFGR